MVKRDLTEVRKNFFKKLNEGMPDITQINSRELEEGQAYNLKLRALGIRQQDAAKAVGVSSIMMNRYLTGRARIHNEIRDKLDGLITVVENQPKEWGG